MARGVGVRARVTEDGAEQGRRGFAGLVALFHGLSRGSLRETRKGDLGSVC